METDSPATGLSGLVAQLQARAESGDVRAMFDLGCLHDLPPKPGVTVDLDRALHWYTRAAEAGDGWARFALGNMNERAHGVPRNDLAARRWYELAARQGVAEAQMHLGRMLQTGRGGPADAPQAADWFGKAAAQGHEKAATHLALMMLQGDVPVPEPGRIRSLLEFAADKLDGTAHLVLGDLLLRGLDGPRHGGLALMHYCVAVALLPPGEDARRATEVREAMLSRQPRLRESYEAQALAFVEARRPPAQALAAAGGGTMAVPDPSPPQDPTQETAP